MFGVDTEVFWTSDASFLTEKGPDCILRGLIIILTCSFPLKHEFATAINTFLHLPVTAETTGSESGNSDQKMRQNCRNVYQWTYRTSSRTETMPLMRHWIGNHGSSTPSQSTPSTSVPSPCALIFDFNHPAPDHPNDSQTEKWSPTQTMDILNPKIYKSPP